MAQEDSNVKVEYEVLDKDNDPDDISSADEILLRMRQPDGSVLDKTKSSGDVTFTTNGTDGLIQYTLTQAEAVDGKWHVQARVTIGTNTWWTGPATHLLFANLKSA